MTSLIMDSYIFQEKLLHQKLGPWATLLKLTKTLFESITRMIKSENFTQSSTSFICLVRLQHNDANAQIFILRI